jgi:hypothetical protein
MKDVTTRSVSPLYESGNFWQRCPMTGKINWHWTAKGWKRIPHRLPSVKTIAMLPKRKSRKRGRVAAATVDEVLTFYQARKLAAAKLAADAFVASIPKDTGRRRLGHYADLCVKENRPAGTFLDPPAHHLGRSSASPPVP